MRIDGYWLVCDDGIVRPVLEATVEAADGSPVPVRFLIDSGADCTVLCGETIEILGLPILEADQDLAGVGGVVRSARVRTSVRLVDAQGHSMRFEGHIPVVLSAESLDMSVLGRDILNLFAVILDRRREVVWLLSPPQGYEIVEAAP